MDEIEAEKIRTYERYRCGEITEQEVREALGDETIDAMQADVEAFKSAMELDTSVVFACDDIE
ncbi:hypothetical protein SAMN05444422_11113 [Halobiforma haloterrestris]|uniref:Uncharacterized protein n=1 Tax=Natronobacterium haloterrestre TaxID=148448 RepID=A0A1I1KC06_NATHA|nr:hypothetical protein [Halobiforma haloterrestris]SFC58035.1 hypothetical protein SAMN05444422_11113 [Halobiforma haloterrestris]